MIGIFDSGFGGLSILKDVHTLLPHYSYMYLGDTARAPYGNRTMESVHQFTRQGVEFLFNHGCTMVLIACNTASAEALRKLQHEYASIHPERKVLGVIVPAVEEAIDRTRNGRIGVIATQGTVASETFVREFKKRLPDGRIFQKSCPLLVSLVETGEHESTKAETIIKTYLAPLLEQDIDTLVLGCTHYGHLEAKIRIIVGEQVVLVSEGEITGRKLSSYLERHPEVESRILKHGELMFYTTGREDRFQTLGSEFFGRPITSRKAKMIK